MHEYAATTLLKVSFYKYNKPVYSKHPVFVDIVIYVEVHWLYIVILSVVLIHIGRPSDLYDVQNVDWAPTLKLGHSKQPTMENNNEQQQSAQTTMENNNEQQQITTDLDGSRPQQQQQSAEMVTLALCPSEPEVTSNLIGDVIVSHHEQPTFNDINNEISCQTHSSWKILMGIEEEDQNLRSELYVLRSTAMNSKPNEQSFKDNEEKTKYYTGLPNFLVLMQVFHLCENYISITSQSVLGKYEQFVLVLMRLSLNLPIKDLAYRFGISQPTVSRIWHKWIHVLYKITQFLIQWPERDVLQATMPMEF